MSKLIQNFILKPASVLLSCGSPRKSRSVRLDEKLTPYANLDSALLSHRTLGRGRLLTPV